MTQIEFDFNCMMSHGIGVKHGVSPSDISAMSGIIRKSHRHLQSVISNSTSRVNLSLEWTQLPFQNKKDIENIQRLGGQISKKYENVIFLGIGGSYLGLKAAQDALCPLYYNEFSNLRKGSPKVYFEGNNLDPQTLNALLKNLNPRNTCVVVISKSGETTETKVVFGTVESWLKKSIGKNYGRNIIAITDPKIGALRRRVDAENDKDPLTFRSLSLLKGVGGRYSEFNMGLLHLAVLGIKINEVLEGAKLMAKVCSNESVYKNPAYMYAVLHYILYKKKAKPIAIMMPFSEGLKSTADWYLQLLAESLGKKHPRKIIFKQGLEYWQEDKGKVINVGRTPISCRGTNDLHSIHQNNVEGENNKVVTFLRVEEFTNDKKINQPGDFLSGKKYSQLMRLAQEATQWSLTRENRPNCTIILPKVTPFVWGGLIYFFEMATAFEGELLNANAFDQPGVEGYKNYMYYKLNKPGYSKEIARDIKKHSVKKQPAFII